MIYYVDVMRHKEIVDRVEKFKNDMEVHEKGMNQIKFGGNFSDLTVYRMLCAFLGLDPDKELQKIREEKE